MFGSELLKLVPFQNLSLSMKLIVEECQTSYICRLLNPFFCLFFFCTCHCQNQAAASRVKSVSVILCVQSAMQNFSYSKKH